MVSEIDTIVLVHPNTRTQLKSYSFVGVKAWNESRMAS